MERIGDHATDISELAVVLSKKPYVKKLDHIEEMAKETMVMLIQSLEAFVEKDLDKAQKVIAHDDVVDDLFEIIKIIAFKSRNSFLHSFVFSVKMECTEKCSVTYPAHK